MAGAVPNQLLDLLRALRRRRYQVVVPALLVATLGIAYAVIVPKKYRVTMRIDIGDRTRVDSDARLKNPQEVAVRREAGSANEHIRSPKRVKEVIEANQALWPEYVQAQNDNERYFFINTRILKNLSAQPTTTKESKGGGTIFIEVAYSDENPARAARLLEDLSKSWLEEVFETDRNELITARAKYQDMIGIQETELRVVEDRLFRLLEMLGIDPSSTTSSDSRREPQADWTFKTLDKAKTDLAETEFQLKTAEFELQQANERLAATPETLPERLELEPDDPEAKIGAMRKELEALREEIANLRPMNSRYKLLQPKIEELEQEIADLESTEPEPDSRWVDEENPLHADYELEVLTKREAVGKLEKMRVTLVEDVERLTLETQSRSAQYKQLEELKNQVSVARQRLNETTKEWQAKDTSLQLLDSSNPSWSISSPPMPSSASTQPNPWLLSAVSVVAGLALGIGLAVLTEFARSCYRSAADLASVMNVPVLGAIDSIVTQRERRRLQLAHATAGLSTAVIVGTIGWITYLWYSSPERLPLELQDAIERLRSALK